MASGSEVTFGSRLNNASTISTHLKSFKDYVPPKAAYSIANLDAFIVNIETQNNNVAFNRQGYSAAVELRQKLFKKEADSLSTIMSPLGAAVRACFGKNSKEAADIAALIIKIRGVKIKKDKAEPDDGSVSQSERSFGSVTQHFSDIISTLRKFEGQYTPADKSLAIEALETKLQRLIQANKDVPAAYGMYIRSVNERGALYKSLSELIQGIKDAVKSQYRLSSTEYRLIKGLKV